MLRYHPKYSETDPDNPRAWGTCDRCGFTWPLDSLRFQYDYRGSAVLQNIRILCCRKCLDQPQQQLTPNILPPDPPPFLNARPEPYQIDEAGGDQELELEQILNFVGNCTVDVSDNTQLYLLIWGDRELYWGANQLAWSEGLVQPLAFGADDLYWGGYEAYWG